MAKKQGEEDIPAGLKELPPVVKDLAADPEKEALKKELAELRAMLAQLTQPKDEPQTLAFTADFPYWRVELRGCYAREVMARDEGHAWDVYKKMMGILYSEHQPRCKPSTEEAYRAEQKELEQKRLGSVCA